MFIDPAAGQQLDALGAGYGLVRKSSETDDEFRNRLKSWIRGLGAGDANMYAFEEQEQVRVITHNCECGAHKCGYVQKGLGHSSWCPMYL